MGFIFKFRRFLKWFSIRTLSNIIYINVLHLLFLTNLLVNKSFVAFSQNWNLKTIYGNWLIDCNCFQFNVELIATVHSYFSKTLFVYLKIFYLLEEFNYFFKNQRSTRIKLLFKQRVSSIEFPPNNNDLRQFVNFLFNT